MLCSIVYPNSKYSLCSCSCVSLLLCALSKISLHQNQPIIYYNISLNYLHACTHHSSRLGRYARKFAVILATLNMYILCTHEAYICSHHLLLLLLFAFISNTHPVHPTHIPHNVRVLAFRQHLVCVCVFVFGSREMVALESVLGFRLTITISCVL